MWILKDSKCFNSTLVQLKDILSFDITINLQRFNSTLVQLKVPVIEYFFEKSICFNSTLVQLKGLPNTDDQSISFVSILP